MTPFRTGVILLGDPEATSRDDAIFSGERHFWHESVACPKISHRPD